VIVNRVLPEEGAGPLFREYLTAQKHYLEEIEESFPGLPVFRVPHIGKEARGVPLLGEIGRALYDGKDPADVFCTENPFRFTPQDGAYLVEIHLPFLGSEDVSVLQYGSELVVQVRGQRRSIFLPGFLGFYSAQGARLEEGWLHVRFEKAEAERT
jgi:arsenite-transporting ATPase